MRNAKRGAGDPAGAWPPGFDTCRKRLLVLFLGVLLAPAVHLSADSLQSSSLEGVVAVWASDERVPGVTITATGEDQPGSRETRTDASGRFRFPLLPPGTYSVVAEAAGYSSVTLVGVVVVPGEERRVRLEVTRTDEEESVTETIDAELQPQGLDGGWVVPVAEAETLPLVRGTVDEMAVLFPTGSSRVVADGTGTSPPIEASGPASVAVAVGGAGFGRVPANRLLVVPRWGGERIQGSVRLVLGEEADEADDDAGEPDGSRDGWFRGVLTLGGSGLDGNVSGFLSVDHDEGDRGVASSRRTAIRAATALSTATGRSLFLTAEGSVLDDPVGPDTTGVDRTRWLVRASHAWQVSDRVANTLGLSVDERADDLTIAGAGTDVRSVQLRARSVHIDERLAWLPGSRIRHEMRGGVTARLGMDDRLTLVDSMSGTRTLRGDRDEIALWLEDEILLDRLVVRGGLRLDRRDRAGDSATDVGPRVAIAWHTSGEDPLVLRGSWGRFHEAPMRLDIPFAADGPGPLSEDFDPGTLRTMRTDRAVAGAARDLSGLAAWSLDVVSSRTVDVPFVLDGSLQFGEVDRLEVTVGGRLDVFGKADAVLAWTWSDSDSEVPGAELPEYRGSLALRTALPAGWAAGAIVRHDSGLPCGRRCVGAVDEGSSTRLDLSVSKLFNPGEAAVRIAVEAFNMTDERTSWSNGHGGFTRLVRETEAMPGRSLALNVSCRFGE